MLKTLGVFFLVLCLQGCSDNRNPPRQVHTAFADTTGLTVTDNNGKIQQLIPESLGVRVVVSPSTEWIVVEDMQFSNLVVIRAFQYTGNGYREVPLPQIKQQWEAIARNAGVKLEDLTHTRVGIEEFGPRENILKLSFQADAAAAGEPDLVSVIEIKLDQHKED